jgi:putative sigma-54 modulation protein
MNIVVTARHLELTPALREYAEQKVRKFDRYFSHISEVDVTLTAEKNRHKADVLIKANGMLIQAEGATTEIYSAIDEVVEKLERQIKKYKEKLTSRRKAEPKGAAMAAPEAPAPEEGRIIKVKRFDLKPMTPEEASLQMELLNKSFFIFTNALTGDINVLYKRNDGNYGLIEPLK